MIGNFISTHVRQRTDTVWHAAQHHGAVVHVGTLHPYVHPGLAGMLRVTDEFIQTGVHLMTTLCMCDWVDVRVNQESFPALVAHDVSPSGTLKLAVVARSTDSSPLPRTVAVNSNKEYLP